MFTEHLFTKQLGIFLFDSARYILGGMNYHDSSKVSRQGSMMWSAADDAELILLSNQVVLLSTGRQHKNVPSHMYIRESKYRLTQITLPTRLTPRHNRCVIQSVLVAGSSNGKRRRMAYSGYNPYASICREWIILGLGKTTEDWTTLMLWTWASVHSRWNWSF